MNKENEKSGVKVTMLAFMIKAAVAALKKFPEFNASLDGDNLILKKYYHIGFAADTPNGLVVPVIRDADQKGVTEIANEMGDLAKLARDGKLKPDQMQGGTLHDLVASAASAAPTSRRSSTRPKSRSSACASSYWKPVWRRQGVGAAPHAAAVAVVGPPRDRRRRRGALQQLLRNADGRHAAHRCCKERSWPRRK